MREIGNRSVAELSDSEIEESLFAQVRSQQLKLAMIVALAFGLDHNDDELIRIHAAFQRLVSDQKVITSGNTSDWTRSEIARA